MSTPQKKHLIDSLQTEIKTLKKDKLVLESLMQDLIREKEIHEIMPEDQILNEIFSSINAVKKSQETQSELLTHLDSQREKLHEIIVQPGMAEALKHPLKAKILSLLNSKDKVKK